MTAVKIANLHALVVDDSLIWRTQMRHMLEQAGFTHIEDAATAADANGKMEARRFDVVFLDWRMPGKSGVSLLEQWRSDMSYDDVAVIIVSAVSEQRMIQGALKSGALGYLVKPFTEEVLREHIGKVSLWLDQRHKLREGQPKESNEELREGISGIVSQAMVETFDRMLGETVAGDTRQPAAVSGDAVLSRVRLNFSTREVDFFFIFDRQLLRKPASRFFTPEVIETNRVLEDIAGEVVNILGHRVKTYLGEELGYWVNIGLPYEPEATELGFFLKKADIEHLYFFSGAKDGQKGGSVTVHFSGV